MINLSSKIIKFLLITVIIFLVGVIIFIRSNQIRGVKEYKTIYLGMDAVQKPGSKTIWAPPDDYIPEYIKFVVYSLNDESMCIGQGCGVGGYFVECLGGWITGYGTDSGDVLDYGMDEAGIDIFKEKYITVADANGKVVGIYPEAGIKNIPHIMNNHRDLAAPEIFEKCSKGLPDRWK